MGDDQTEDEFNETMRAEWAKTRARMCRWKEELQIIQEEMRRMISYFEWRAEWWTEQGDRRLGVDAAVLSGISAYAHKQANICRRMAARCAAHWLPIMKKHGVTPSWSGRYRAESPRSQSSDSASESEDDNDDQLDKRDDRSEAGAGDVRDISDFD